MLRRQSLVKLNFNSGATFQILTKITQACEAYGHVQ